MATELLINIVSQATGKGFLESEKAVNKLEKKVKSLSKTLGVSLAAGAALKFSKIYVKAFAEDEKATLQLTKAVDNLGLGFASPSINKYIENLEKTAAISRTELRPAFQDLLTTTGSLTTAQDLLNKSIIISRGSGIALSTVTEDLTKAYLGSTKGLEKYKTGFTGAELAAKSFSENLEILLRLNQGAADDYFTTTAFKLELLAIAGESAKITIGEGLVEGLGNFAGSGEASDAVNVINDLSQALSFFLKLGGSALGLLARIPEFGFRAIGLGAMYDRPETVVSTETEFTKKQKELIAKLDAAAAKRAKQLADLAKKQANAEILKRKEKEKQAKLDKAALSLGKGEDIFDLDKIQVQAALLAKQDEINKLGVNATDQQKLQLANDLTRLSIKQTMAQLEDAIAAQDVEAATRLAKKLNLDLAILGALQNQEFKLKDIEKILNAMNPKKLIDLDNLEEALLLLGKMAGLKIGGIKLEDAKTPLTPLTPKVPFTPITPKVPAAAIPSQVSTLTSLRAATSTGTGINFLLKEQIDALTDAMSTNALNALGDEQARLRELRIAERPGIGADSMFDPAFFRRGEERGNTYNVNINAGVIGNEDGVATVVQKAILDLERRGDPLRYTGGL
jgi:hypothetical protein